jgi:hypothetical protein
MEASHMDSTADAGGSPAESLAAEPGEGLPDRLTINLAPDTRRRLTDGGRVTLTAAVRRLVHDRLTLFEMPLPSRAVLLREMEQLGVTSQRDYIVWLLMERYRQIVSQERGGR